MNSFGLTGGIACGKTTLGELMQLTGWKLVDADAIAHRLLQPEQINWKKVIDAFGRSILNEDRTINRRALGELVFSDPALRKKLEQLTHPAIRETWQAERARLREHFPEAKIVVVIPLLFEGELEREFTATLCVGCSPATQWHRLKWRGWSDAHIQARLTSQWPIEKKMQKSDFVFWNEGTRHSLEEQLKLLSV
jgi:dephospho-CoA kinase